MSATDWCGPDDCPAFVCGGPHVLYVNDHGDQCLCPPGMAPPAGYRRPTADEIVKKGPGSAN